MEKNTNTILSKVENLMEETMHNISNAIEAKNAILRASEGEKLKTLKLIKAALTKANTTKEYALNEDKEVSTLIEMVEQRKKSIGEYKKGGREDLVEIEQGEINFIFKELFFLFEGLNFFF